jgi:hypothetical protein
MKLKYRAVLAASFLLMTACASVGSLDDDRAALPVAFAIDLTVLSGDPEQSLAPVDRRTARYVLTPDGALHVGSGSEAGGDHLRPHAFARRGRGRVASAE